MHRSSGVADIDHTLAEWRTAFARGDIGGLTALVTEDAEFWTQDQPPVRGREALAETFRGFFRDYICDQEFDVIETIVCGDLALLRGVEHNSIERRADGARFDLPQRAFSVLRREADARWRFARGMVNRGPIDTV